MSEFFDFKLAFDENEDPCYVRRGEANPEPDVDNAPMVVDVRLRRPTGKDTIALSKLGGNDAFEGQDSMLRRLLHSISGWRGGPEKTGKAALAELDSLPTWAHLRACLYASNLVGGEFEKLGESAPPSATSST